MRPSPSIRRAPSEARAPRLRGALALLLGILVLGLSGCVKRFPNPFDRSGAQANAVELTVDNQNFNDTRIWKVGPEGRQSVGHVTGRSTQTFSVPWRQTNALRFQIEVLAGRTYETNSVTASPGDRLHLYIRENPNNTYLTKR